MTCDLPGIDPQKRLSLKHLNLYIPLMMAVEPAHSYANRMVRFCTVAGLLLAAVILNLTACSDDNSTDPDTPIEPNLLDERIETVGYHCICWNQSLGETSAQPGRYALRMVAEDFDWTTEFSIDQSSVSQPAWECCDTSTVSILAKAHVDPPEFFGFKLSAERYAPGDTVSIELAVPAPAQVKLQVSRIN